MKVLGNSVGLISGEFAVKGELPFKLKVFNKIMSVLLDYTGIK